MVEKKTNSKQLTQIAQLEEAAIEVPVEIVTEAQAFLATDLILKIRSKFTEIDAIRKERTAPASETVKLINEDYKKFLVPLKEAEERLSMALAGYATRRIQEDLTKQAELRKETGDNTLMIPIGLKSIPSNAGDVRFRKAYTITILDEAKVPKKYKQTVINTKAMQADVDSAEGDISIPGVEVTPSATIAIYAN